MGKNISQNRTLEAIIITNKPYWKGWKGKTLSNHKPAKQMIESPHIFAGHRPMSIRAVLFLLSGPVYSCAAYAAVYAMPTWPQWEPTRLIPLKVCLRRPNARVKRRLNVRFCLRRHTSVCFWKVGYGTFAYATTVPFTFLLSGMPYGTLHSLQQHERPGSKAPIDILQPHPCAAAAPATRSQSAH